MRTYRNIWTVAFAALVIASLLIGGLGRGWVTVAVLSAFGICLGSALGYAWFETPEARRRAITGFTTWFVATGLLVLGLGELMGAWAMLALVVIGASVPDAVAFALGLVKNSRPVRHPDRYSDRELARRWTRTTDEIRSSAVSPHQAARLAEERASLLDELERRDPQRFADRLARLGWREPQDS